jgi:hypothetical protein
MRTITLTHQTLTEIIADAVAQGIRAYEASKGGEVSYRQGVKIYGQWFVDAAAKGRVKGVRRGAATNSKITYQVRDIEAQRTKEAAETSNILNTK